MAVKQSALPGILLVGALALVTCAGKIAFAAPIIDQNVVALPTVIDFGSAVLPDGAPVNTQFVGVTFGPTYSYVDCISCNSAFQTRGHLNNEFFNLTRNQPGPILFSNDVTAAAFSWITNTGSTTFSAWLDGNLIESFTASWVYNTNNVGHYFGFTGIRFDEIRMLITSDNTAFVLDNLKYQTAPAVAPVPLPAALPLFATILAGGGLIAWRRKRKVGQAAA